MPGGGADGSLMFDDVHGQVPCPLFHVLSHHLTLPIIVLRKCMAAKGPLCRGSADPKARSRRNTAVRKLRTRFSDTAGEYSPECAALRRSKSASSVDPLCGCYRPQVD